MTGYELDAPAITGEDARLTPIVEACAETGSLDVVGVPVEGKRAGFTSGCASAGQGALVRNRTCGPRFRNSLRPIR